MLLLMMMMMMILFHYEQLYSNFIDDAVISSSKWIQRRRTVAFSFLQFVHQMQSNTTLCREPKTNYVLSLFPTVSASITDSCRSDVDDRAMYHGGGDERSDEHRTAQITLVITTCKRLNLFITTMDQMLESAGPLPNALITAVIVIDDQSTQDDQMIMLQRYPNVTFLFKPHSTSIGGHAHSMNIMFRLVATEYLIYLEDDWLLRIHDAMLMHPSWIELIQSLNRLNVIDDDDDGPMFESFYCIIVYALSILGFEGRINLPIRHGASEYTSINLTRAYRNSSDDHRSRVDVPVHQVLFNEQSSRDCAIGSSRCHDSRSQLSFGGWKMHHDIHIHSSRVSINASIPYSLHEFGLAALSSLTFSNHRNHEFSYWPGFSFNPGLWNMEAVRRSLVDYIGIGNDVFDVTDHGFEQKFSVLAYEVGLNMAYLPIVIFEEISREQSAYRLKNIKRPWEK